MRYHGAMFRVLRATATTLALTVLVLLAACRRSDPPEARAPEPEPPPPPAAEPRAAAPEGRPDAAPIPSAWVDARVEAARARLASSEAGRLLWDAIEAHGGLRRWLSAGTITFDFDYDPYGQPERRMHTRQRVDLWRARAVHEELGDDADAHFGWNGRVAWIVPGPDAFPSPARFWALTPYYFVGMPFVLGDPGVRLERLPDATLDGRTWPIVKATFEAGTGDAPDDYYVLYLDPASKRVHALRYVVSYPGFAGKAFEPGGHTPETLMRLTEQREVDGLLLPGRLDTWRWNVEEGAPGDPRVRVTAKGYALGQTIPASAFDPPGGAHVTDAL